MILASLPSPHHHLEQTPFQMAVTAPNPFRERVVRGIATSVAISVLMTFLFMLFLVFLTMLPILTLSMWVPVPAVAFYFVVFLNKENKRKFVRQGVNTAHGLKHAIGAFIVQLLHRTLVFALDVLSAQSEVSNELAALEILIKLTRDPRPMTIQRFRTTCEGYHFLFWYNKAVHRDTKYLPASKPDRDVMCWFMRTSIEPAASPSIMLYLHGGGFIAGTAGAYRGMISPIAKRINCNVFAVEYRKMPEHPLPAAVDDALVAYKYLLHEKNFDPKKVILAGDSAGGSLCLLLLLRIKQEGLEQPCGAMLMSPYVDLTVSTASWVRNRGKDFILSEQVIDAARDMFTQQKDFSLEQAKQFSPAIFPVSAFEGLPPIFLSYSTAEPLVDEIKMFIEKAQKAGVELDIVEKHGCPHVFQMYVFIVFVFNFYAFLRNVRRTYTFCRSLGPSFAGGSWGGVRWTHKQSRRFALFKATNLKA